VITCTGMGIGVLMGIMGIYLGFLLLALGSLAQASHIFVKTHIQQVMRTH